MPGRPRSVVARGLVALVAAAVSLGPAVVAPAPALAALPPVYTVPDPLPPAPPGTIIASEDLGPVPGGERQRILYHSRSITGADIAVSGLLFVPSAAAPPGGRPVLAWAHGTTGAADPCAPSLGGYDPELLSDWLARGYVVAATDYQGLGTPGLHPYLLGDSEGRGVLDSVRAARAFPGADALGPVVIYGHSQGGHATIFANELAPTYAPELPVVGAVAAAPASQIVFAFQLIDTSPVIRAAAVMMGAGFAQEYGLDVHAIFTAEAVNRIGIVDTGCQPEVAAAYADLTGPQTVQTPPGEVPGWREALAAAEPGQRPEASPLLMYQGTADEEVPYIAGQILDARLCATGVPHVFTTYPGANHSQIIDLGRQATLDFADARVRGDAFVPDACPQAAPTTTGPPTPVPTVTPAFTG